MIVTELELKECVRFSRRLPEDRDLENIKRLVYVAQNGQLLIYKEQGKIKGYAELYRMNYIPSHPVEPLPIDNPDGEYLYCWAAVSEKGYLFKLIRMAKITFKSCKFLIWHTHKKNSKLHMEKI